MKKKLLAGLLVMMVILLVTGCYSTETTFQIEKNGQAEIEFLAQADQTLAGDELNTAMWGLINSFPELKENYEITRETRTVDYSNYVYYKFESEDKVDINSMENINFKQNGGQYNFQMDIPSLVDDVNENNKDDVIFVINIEMPEEIDMANTSTFEGNQASWKISREKLVDGLTLKAYTK